MKNLFLGLMLLTSATTYAMTDFEKSLSDDPAVLKASSNYEAKFVNDDGSTTILRPMFSSPTGQGSIRISVKDDDNLKGTCKLFGFSSYVSNSALYEELTLVTTLEGYVMRINRNNDLLYARISLEGTFETFDSSKNKNALKSLVCR